MADHDRCLTTHLGCVPLGNKPGDPKGPVRRLVSVPPATGSGLRHPRDASARAPRRKNLEIPGLPVLFPIRWVPRRLIADRILRGVSAWISSHGSPPVFNNKGDRLDRSPPCRIFSYMEKEYRNPFPDAQEFQSTSGISARIATVMLVADDRHRRGWLATNYHAAYDDGPSTSVERNHCATWPSGLGDPQPATRSARRFFFIAVYIHIFRGMYLRLPTRRRASFMDPGRSSSPCC